MTKANRETQDTKLERPSGIYDSLGLTIEDITGLSSGITRKEEIVLLDSEKALVHELVQALRTIQFGSILLTVHEGHLVEINKSVRIRKSRRKAPG